MTQHLSRITIGRADVDFNTLSVNGESGQFTIEPKVMAVLRALSDNAGNVVERDTLIDLVWGTPYGSDQRLSRAISLLRKAFGDVRGKCDYIETIPKRGYRLIAGLGNAAETESTWQTPPRATSPKAGKLSIAVLPFVDMSEDQNQGYLADGVCEEIINVLAQVPNLKVTGRTSSFAFKGRNQDIREIAQALNVAYVLEGSLRKFGDKLRVTAQLIQSSDGFHLFSKTYEAELKEIFDLQDRIAHSVVNEFCELLEVAGEQDTQRVSTRNSQAYDFFLQGRQLVHQLNGQTTIPTGIEFLQKATQSDPEFALAWAWLALAHFILPEFSRTQEWEGHLEQSRSAVESALDLDPNSSIGLLVKAMIYSRDGQFDLALVTHKRALEVDPNNIETLAGMGLGLMAIGLYEEARPYFDRVLEQDPLSGVWHTTYGGLLLSVGEFEKAEASFKRSFDLGFGAAAFGVSHRMACKGDVDQAVAFMNENYDGLGPIEHAELKSPLIRKMVFNAYLRKAKVAQALVNFALKRRSRNAQAQPTAASIIGFLFLDRPEEFMRNVLEKPNPYIGYTLARIWEPTEESHNIRVHADFPEFVEQLGLVNAWRENGWPKQLVPSSHSDKANSAFSVIA